MTSKRHLTRACRLRCSQLTSAWRTRYLPHTPGWTTIQSVAGFSIASQPSPNVTPLSSRDLDVVGRNLQYLAAETWDGINGVSEVVLLVWQS